MSTRTYPIIFSAKSISAIFNGLKSNTMRVIVPTKSSGVSKKMVQDAERIALWQHDNGRAYARIGGMDGQHKTPFPFFSVGSLLWVKEVHDWISLAENEYDPSRYDHKRHPDGYPAYMLYKADGVATGGTWRSPRFMPRWASRLDLVVNTLRICRLQDMTLAEFVAEGFEFPKSQLRNAFVPDMTIRHRPAFAEVVKDGWDALNARRGYPFDSDPWVWSIGFFSRFGYSHTNPVLSDDLVT